VAADAGDSSCGWSAQQPESGAARYFRGSVVHRGEGAQFSGAASRKASLGIYSLASTTTYKIKRWPLGKEPGGKG
jgi:hypothetical protein